MFCSVGFISRAYKRLAWWLSSIVQPLQVFRWTGVLSYRTISYAEFSPIPFCPDAQSVMDTETPQSISHDLIWSITPPSDVVMSHVLSIQGGIADGLGNVFDPLTGRLISGATHKYRYKVKRAYIPRPHRIFPFVENVSGEVAVITASNQHIYWHWLLDIMPRLLMLEEMEKMPSSLFIQTKLPFQHEMLGYLGILPKCKIIDCEKTPMIAASALLVPCHQIMEGREFPKWVCQGLRKKFLPFSQPSKAGSSGRVYISRAGASQRRISNEKQLLPILRDYGFHVVRLEELTFKEQVGLFSSAEVVVAPNGSGLANLVFSSKGTTVIEIFPKIPHVLNATDLNFNFDYNYRLSRALELNYYFVSGTHGDVHLSKVGDYSLSPEDLVHTFALAKVKI